ERLRRDEAEDRRVQAGRQLPDFAIPSLADSTVMITRADLSGKTVLVDFWGTWCSPCIAELPQLHELHEQYADEGFDILSIATFDTRGAIATFREDRGFPMPWRHALLPDDQMEWARDRFEFTGIPAYLLVAPDGSILAEGWDARGIGLVTALETWFGDE
ncbi:MAG: TlpA disulfide reductase family protein, partial [Bacteroidota bacterium]